jgi:hypothetical protein
MEIIMAIKNKSITFQGLSLYACGLMKGEIRNVSPKGYNAPLEASYGNLLETPFHGFLQMDTL